ncbi:uncharacterized protein LOC127641323 [Xyrauchen texanus]|uniref:uncharacterized protein LOC127641323 n=1 Tax=Xyrauchen texanus TaxID=154827 RepID=UPI00224259A7|nr:uncharacterized protein LOC127641323 [Xyrauchen texanus]
MTAAVLDKIARKCQQIERAQSQGNCGERELRVIDDCLRNAQRISYLLPLETYEELNRNLDEIRTMLSTHLRSEGTTAFSVSRRSSGPNATLLQLPAPPELANTAIRQPQSPASSDISGCSRPMLHRSPTRSESTETFSPVSARSRRSRTPQRGVRMPSQSGSRKGSRGSRTPQRGVRMTSQSRSRSLFPMSQAKYQKSVLGKLVELLDEIKRVGRHYEPLNSAVHVARLETLEEFAQEEARLKDRNLWEQRVSQLSKVGGRNDKDCVHKVMDRLFTNSLMASFNMKGRGSSEKKAFQDTTFYSVVKAAVMKWSKTATEVEIRAAMAETLKHAPGRAGGGGRKV